MLAGAIRDEAARRGLEPAAVDELRVVPGHGIAAALVDGTPVRLGSDRWIAAEVGDRGPPADDARPSCTLAIGGRAACRITFDESIRPVATAAIAGLTAAGAEVRILSGDRAGRARAVADALGTGWRAPLLPAEKLAFVSGRPGSVMIGDGINDAPALAAADVGAALGCGADVSRWTAAICLLRDDLGDLPWLLMLARRTDRTIRWNLFWAFGYNAACIPLAAAGLLHPAVAAAAMLASSLFMVSGSLALARGDDDPPRPAPASPVAHEWERVPA